MLLGDVLARFDDETVAAETILGLGDLALVARLRERAEAVGQSLGEYAASTVRCYAASAPDEEWITLMGVVTISSLSFCFGEHPATKASRPLKSPRR